MNTTRPGSLIYIPIWLDLLSTKRMEQTTTREYLHSNMVRFIIPSDISKTMPGTLIYIPIWLDLL